MPITKNKKATKKSSVNTKTTKVVSKKVNKKKTYKDISFATTSTGVQWHLDRKKALRSTTVYGNKEKRKIAIDMLERYTGHKIEDFQPQIILTNFHYYVERFNVLMEDCNFTQGSAFKASSSKISRVTIIEFGLGSAMAALVMELVAVIEPKAVLFLGMCGAIHESLNVGDFILPIAAIRAEGVSTHFMPPQVPALPTFKVQKFLSQILVEHGHDYRTGTVHSTDLRFWEFDKVFKNRLIQERVLAIEMECAALFVTAFANKVSVGAILLVSDCPMKRGGIKTKKSASSVFKNFTDKHIELGIETMADIAQRGERIRQYRW
jgi:AMP nucleosidase